MGCKLRESAGSDVDTYKDIGAVGAWSPAVGGTVWAVEDAATLR